MNNKITKIDYTLKFFNLLNIEDNEVNRKKYLDFWWFNIREESTHGLRLTKPGYLTITKELQLKEYMFDLDIDDYQGKLHLYLDLDHYLPSPYFIHSSKSFFL